MSATWKEDKMAIIGNLEDMFRRFVAVGSDVEPAAISAAVRF